MTHITACWYLSSLKIKEDKKIMFEQFTKSDHKNLDLFNRLQIDLV